MSNGKSKDDEKLPEDYYFVHLALSTYSKQIEKQMPLLLTFLKDSAKDAKEREKHINSIKESKYFLKLKKGVSDALKAKCLPLNKKTAESIKALLDEFETNKKAVLAGVGAGKKILEKKNSGKDMDLFLQGRDYIQAWKTFDQRARLTIKGCVGREQLAIKILDDYIRDKNTMKELGEEAYKKFKQEQERLADFL